MHINQKLGVAKAGSKDTRVVSKRALLQILKPIAGFVLDSGISAPHLCNIVRQAMVHHAALRQIELSERMNISGIAAITGLSRSEVSQILKSGKQIREEQDEGHFQSTNRILSAWYTDPKYLSENGLPSDIPIYGRVASFDALVKKYGFGLPTRAVLDELLRFGAIEMLSDQTIRPRTSMAIERGMTPRVVKTFGDRASELLSSMLHNMRVPDDPRFVASVADGAVLRSALPLFRKELSQKGADFLSEMEEILSQHSVGRGVKSSKQDSTAITVTLFYHEKSVVTKKVRPKSKTRRNFRRKIKP